MALVLTKGQKLTMDRLNKRDYDSIKQADITRLLSRVLDQKQSAEDLVPKVIDYEKVKFPQKTVKDIEKYLTKKIKQKDDRAMFREVISDYSSFETGGKETSSVTGGKETVTEVLPSRTKTTKTSGTDKQLNDLLDKLLDEGGGGDQKSTPTPFAGEGRKLTPDEPKSSETWLEYLDRQQKDVKGGLTDSEVKSIKTIYNKAMNTYAKKRKDRLNDPSKANVGGLKDSIAKTPFGDIDANAVADGISATAGTGTEVVADTLLTPILGPELASVVGKGAGKAIESLFDSIGNAWFDTSKYTPPLEKGEGSFIVGIDQDGNRDEGMWDTRNGKQIVEKGSYIDLAQHLSQVKASGAILQQLYNTAESLGELTKGESELIYNVSETLSRVASGKSKISYEQLGDLMKVTLSNLPKDVVDKSMPEIVKYGKEMSNVLGGQNQNKSIVDIGDSSDYGSTTEIETDTDLPTETETEPDEKEPEEKEPEEKEPEEKEPEPEEEIKEEIKETPLDDTSGNNLEDGFPRLRPKGVWGNTDELFIRKEENVQSSALISEMMNVEPAGWGNGSSNVLYKRNLVQDDMRYGRTFSMPPPEPSQSTKIPTIFKERTRPIMTPQYAPAMRPFQSVTWDPYSFGQFQEFGWNDRQPTVYPIENQEEAVNYYPHRINMTTGGEKPIVDQRSFNWIQNQRFLR